MRLSGIMMMVARIAALVVATVLTASVTKAMVSGSIEIYGPIHAINVPSGISTTPRAFVKRHVKDPDPIPEAGQQAALDVMRTGKLYRYCQHDEHTNNSSSSSTTNTSIIEMSLVSQCEKDLCDYTGHQYCIGVNSCGSALMLLLKATGLQPGNQVFCNAFTFGAVPSAIQHAGGIPIYIESTMDLHLDIDDFRNKIIQYPDCQYALVSHMRGMVADMDSIQTLCSQYNIILLEDCAHALGIQYRGKHIGHVGVACAISSQSYKLLNSGEGGFVLTNDPDIAARTVVYSGAYETLSNRHLMVPSSEFFQDYPTTLPNYSLRMSNLVGAIIRPQIQTLDTRIVKYNTRYHKLVSDLKQRIGEHITIPKVDPGVDRMVHDSLQFTLDEAFTLTMVQQFLNECNNHGLSVELFGQWNNARNFVNWGYARSNDPLPATCRMLSRTCDVRLPLIWDEEDLQDLAHVLVESCEAVLRDAEYR